MGYSSREIPFLKFGQAKEGRRIFILIFFLAAACYFDYRYDRIPNRLILLGFSSALLYRGIECVWALSQQTSLQAQLTNAGLWLLRIVLLFLGTYPFYCLRMLGAGDVKLLSMSAAFLSGWECRIFLLGSLFFAAAVSLFKLLVCGNGKERMWYFCSYMADVLRFGRFSLYFEGERSKKASLHMAGPMLAGLLSCIFLVLYEAG